MDGGAFGDDRYRGDGVDALDLEDGRRGTAGLGGCSADEANPRHPGEALPQVIGKEARAGLDAVNAHLFHERQGSGEGGADGQIVGAGRLERGILGRGVVGEGGADALARARPHIQKTRTHGAQEPLVQAGGVGVAAQVMEVDR